jgi:hypothetical protein
MRMPQLRASGTASARAAMHEPQMPELWHSHDARVAGRGWANTGMRKSLA